MNIYKKLLEVQSKLKCNKSQYNSFGKYSYRSCEDVLEALKPILSEVGATIFIKDEVEHVEGRFYIKAIVTFIDVETGESISTQALAREEESKKGQDASQTTGSTSSYARKYALNGMFAIDDTKDADATNTHGKSETKANKLTEKQINRLIAIAKKANVDLATIKKHIKAKFNKTKIEELTKEQYDTMCEGYERMGGLK